MREKDMFAKPSSVDLSSDEAREIILMFQEGYKKRKIEHRLYNEEDYIPENIITMYIYFINHTEYPIVVQNYKKTFIENEAIVEPGVTPEERIGLGIVYDYISSYDFSRKEPNIFIDGLTLHCKLYSACPFPEFGGKLRQDPVRLFDSSYEVPDPVTASRQFQAMLNKQFDIDMDNVLDYIDEVIKISIDLIKLQPFNDGNKRTFRALLNLLLGRIGIPPVYIRSDEREVYKEELLKAIEQNEYKGIIRFYYYKICDSIVELDLMKTKEKEEEKTTSFVIKPVKPKIEE